MPGKFQQERRWTRAIQDPVLVDPTASVAPSVKGIRHDLNGFYRDIVGRECVESAVQPVWFEFRVR